MAKPFLSFIFFLILSTPFTSARPGPKPATFIRAACTASTHHPVLCFRTLSAYAGRIGNSNRQLAAVALAVSHVRVKSAAASLSRLRRAGGGTHRDNEALGDCVIVVADGARQLGRSVVELGRKARPGEEFEWRVSNVETWVSTALTDIGTCLEGFAGRSSIKVAVRRRLAGATSVTSVALALVNRFAAGRG
ncbi:hypothetical protein V2J09_010166 [Rumex salicifolius]